MAPKLQKYRQINEFFYLSWNKKISFRASASILIYPEGLRMNENFNHSQIQVQALSIILKTC
jgi:hypothetical protein